MVCEKYPTTHIGMQRACDVHRFLPQSMSEVAMQSVTSEADVGALLANRLLCP